MDIILPPAPKDHATTKHLLTGCQLGILSFLGLEVLHTETTNPNQTISNSKKLMKSPWISQVNFPSELPSFHAGEHELRLLQHVLWDVTSYLGWIGRPSTNGAFLAKICLNRWTFCFKKPGAIQFGPKFLTRFFLIFGTLELHNLREPYPKYGWYSKSRHVSTPKENLRCHCPSFWVAHGYHKTHSDKKYISALRITRSEEGRLFMSLIDNYYQSDFSQWFQNPIRMSIWGVLVSPIGKSGNWCGCQGPRTRNKLARSVKWLQLFLAASYA